MEVKSKKYSKILELKSKRIICPNCKKPAKDFFTPFCSKKCSDLDLLKWLSDENYINLNTN